MASVASFEPNWCISIDYSKENVTKLLTELSAKGLHALTRPGHGSEITYVFVKDSNNKVRQITSQFPFVKNTIFLADKESKESRRAFAQRLVRGTVVPSEGDLKSLASITGNPATALYFAFSRYYTRWLMGLALVGAAFRFFSEKSTWEFNLSYAIAVAIWAIGFVVMWKNRAEPEYAAKLGYRPAEIEVQASSTKVFVKKMCFIPVALQFAACLICFQFMCFLLEIFITQIYQGPAASLLALVPTVLISCYVPIISMVYEKVLDKLIAWEKPENPVASRLQKKFVLTFLTSYMPLFITVFVYLPLGHHVNAQLETVSKFCAHYGIPVLETGFKVNKLRYQNQFFYFIITNQVIALGLENGLPLLMAKLLPKIKGYEKKNSPVKQAELKVSKEHAEDIPIWTEACDSNLNVWGDFDVNTKFNKLVVQFGYVAMFSTIWPLAALFCVLFNIIEVKLDIWRLLTKCNVNNSPNPEVLHVSSQPLPPYSVHVFWDYILSFVLWFSTIVSPALIAMYRKSPNHDVSSILEKRDAWHLRSVVHNDWKSVIIFSVVFEHLAALSYAVLVRLVGVKEGAKAENYVRAQELEEPPHVDLEKVVKETSTFMKDPISHEKSTVAEKAPIPTNDIGKVKSEAPHTVYQSSKESPQLKEEAAPRQPINTQAVKSSIDNSITSKPHEGHEDGLTGAVKSRSTSSASPVAGATVPVTIPTSKNYHLRYDQSGKSLNVDSNASSSEEGSEKQVPSNASLEKEPQSKVLSTNAPEVITTPPSNETAAGEQFVPPGAVDTSKRHVASILNGNGTSHNNPENVQERHSVGEYGQISEANVGRDADELSENSSPTTSQKHSQFSGTPRKSDKSTSMKKMKGVLSPLGKLKKKFP